MPDQERWVAVKVPAPTAGHCRHDCPANHNHPERCYFGFGKRYGDSFLVCPSGACPHAENPATQEYTAVPTKLVEAVERVDSFDAQGGTDWWVVVEGLLKAWKEWKR